MICSDDGFDLLSCIMLQPICLDSSNIRSFNRAYCFLVPKA
jgi:hypothetical protein